MGQEQEETPGGSFSCCRLKGCKAVLEIGPLEGLVSCRSLAGFISCFYLGNNSTIQLVWRKDLKCRQGWREAAAVASQPHKLIAAS